MHFSSCTPDDLPLNNGKARPASAGLNGVIAQMGERLNGIQEVDGSIPSGSTKLPKSFQ